MKKCVVFCFVLLMLVSLGTAMAQLPLTGNYKVRLIEPFRMAVSTNLTTNIVFPYQIKSVDRGSAVILAQKASGAENVLQIKAAAEDFKESNLSVITADGQLFSFLINYAAVPSFLNLSFYKDSCSSQVQLEGNAVPQDELSRTAGVVREHRPLLRRTTRSQQVWLTLDKVFFHQDLLWFSLVIGNKSLITYQPEYVKFFIEDRKRAKRTATQVKELDVTYSEQLTGVPGDRNGKVVWGLPAFTLGRRQQLRVLVRERFGGRSLELRVPARTLLNAKLLTIQ